MSSHSFCDTCPNCSNDMDVCEDTRTGRSCWCAQCGFTEYSRTHQMDLEVLNSYRISNEEVDPGEWPPLEMLPKWNLDSPLQLWILQRSGRVTKCEPIFSYNPPKKKEYTDLIPDYLPDQDTITFYGPFEIEL